MGKQQSFDDHHDEIKRLYLLENKTVPEIVSFMASERGFHRSKKSYERVLSTWGFRKNVDWKVYGRAIAKRQQDGKESAIHVNPYRRLSPQQVRKGNSRHYVSWCERMQRELFAGSQEDWGTVAPSKGLIRTPSPAPVDLGPCIHPRLSSPWMDFVTWLKASGVRTTRTNLSGDATATVDVSTLSSLPGHVELFRSLPGWATGTYVAEKHQQRISQITSGLGRIMPESYAGQHREMGEIICDGNWSPEYIMAQLFLLANNFTLMDTCYSRETIQTLTRLHDERVITMVQRVSSSDLKQVEVLFSAKGPTAEAIREHIYASALRTANLPLIQTILETGIDADTTIDLPDMYVRRHSSLRAAAYIYDERLSVSMIELLIRHGLSIDALTSGLLPAVRRRHKEVVRLLIQNGARVSEDTTIAALESGDSELAETIMCVSQPIDRSLRTSDRSCTALGLAAKLGNIPVAKLLIALGAKLDKRQQFKCEDRIDPGPYNWPSAVTTVLGLAVSSGRLGMVQFLLKEGAAVDLPPTNRGLSPLFIACYNGHLDIAKTLLDTGADVSLADACGQSFRFHAEFGSCHPGSLLGAFARHAHKDVDKKLCRALISQGARYDRALLDATRENQHDFVSFLLSLPSPLSRSHVLQCSSRALGLAIQRGYVMIIEALCHARVPVPRVVEIHDVTTAAFLDKANLLHGILSQNGQEILDNTMCYSDGLLKYLTEHVAFDHAWLKSTEQLNTALAQGYLERAADLLEHGARPTAISFCCVIDGWENEEIEELPEPFELLLSSTSLSTRLPGAKIPSAEIEGGYQPENDDDMLIQLVATDFLRMDGACDGLQVLLENVDWSPIRLGETLTASIYYGAYHFVPYLLNAGASANTSWTCWNEEDSAFDEHWPLVWAATASTGLVQTLFKHGADINQGAGTGSTALQRAAMDGSMEMVNTLLELGADVNAPAIRGATALQFAAFRGDIRMATRFLAEGANVEAAGAWKRGRTAIEGAAEHGRLEMLDLLLKEQPNVRGDHRHRYRRAVRLAEMEGHKAVASFLKSYGGWASSDDQYTIAMLREEESEGSEEESEGSEEESEGSDEGESWRSLDGARERVLEELEEHKKEGIEEAETMEVVGVDGGAKMGALFATTDFAERSTHDTTHIALEISDCIVPRAQEGGSGRTDEHQGTSTDWWGGYVSPSALLLGDPSGVGCPADASLGVADCRWPFQDPDTRCGEQEMEMDLDNSVGEVMFPGNNVGGKDVPGWEAFLSTPIDETS